MHLRTIIALILVGLLSGGFLHTFAQTSSEILVDGRFEQIAANEIIEEIGNKYGLSVFFPKNYLPLPKATVSFDQVPLEEAIAKTLEHTLMGFLLYRNYAIVIAPQVLLDADFTSNRSRPSNPLSPTPSSQTQTIGSIQTLPSSGLANLTGNIEDADTQVLLANARISCPALLIGTTSDQNGSFLLQLPPGQHRLAIQLEGYDDLEVEIKLIGNGHITFPILQHSISLDEVVIEAEASDASVSQVQTGITRIDVKDVKRLPAVLGEPDIVKNLLLQPGVSSVGEGAGGFNVRGGDVDQNLILQDGAMLFNPTHALGFYSTFNTDLVKDITLYKGAIPATFGGRLASVLNVEMRDGNFEKYKLKGGLGPIASRLSFEGPIQKHKSSFLLGFRSTYSDWILNRINVPEVKRSSVFFYDANFRYTHRINPKNTLIFSAYSTEDRFTYDQRFGFNYKTLLGEIIYKRILNDRLFSHLHISASRFDNEQQDLDGVNASILQNGITHYKLKQQFTYHLQDGLSFDAGLAGIWYHLPGQSLDPANDRSIVESETTDSEQGLETAAFIQGDWRLNNFLRISGGLRLNAYSYWGPRIIHRYQDAYPYEWSNRVGSELQKGSISSAFHLSPRLSVRYQFAPQASIKFGYSRMAQYINQLSNANSPTPSSHWQLSTPYIPPKLSHNFSIGYFMNFANNTWESSFDLYGRYLDQAFDYKNFAELILNDHIETEIRRGIGRAYGLELNLKKTKGIVHGSLSYTLSRSELKIDDINQGDWYAADIDRTHDLSFIANFSYNSRNTFTVSFNYQTGRPTTPPVGNFVGDNGIIIPVYTRRNHSRIPDYHRLDLAYTIGMGHLKTRKLKASWTFSVYNVYARRNAFSVYFTQEPFRPPKAYQLSILGSAFPSISFNLETF